MKIASSNVSMNASTEYNKKQIASITHSILVSDNRLNLTKEQAKSNSRPSNAKILELSLFRFTLLESSKTLNSIRTITDGITNQRITSQEKKEEQKSVSNQIFIPKTKTQNTETKIKSTGELKLELLNKLLTFMRSRGKKPKKINKDQSKNNGDMPNYIDLSSIGQQAANTTSAQNTTNQSIPGHNTASQNTTEQTSQGVYITTISNVTTETYEQEKMSFCSNVSIETDDGRTIDVSVELNLSRELYSKLDTFSLTEEFQKLCDPLVINFGAASADLSDIKFSFDLDCDGKSDQISQLKNGSGFLSLDLNEDGIINDGNELFGASSGNGFADLAKYDFDNNDWLDKNDPIFDKLRIWTKDSDGFDRLIGLGELGIGAICLCSIDTDFSLQSDSSFNGMIRRTGIFLREDGTAGTVQHVDMAI